MKGEHQSKTERITPAPKGLRVSKPCTWVNRLALHAPRSSRGTSRQPGAEGGSYNEATCFSVRPAPAEAEAGPRTGHRPTVRPAPAEAEVGPRAGHPTHRPTRPCRSRGGRSGGPESVPASDNRHPGRSRAGSGALGANEATSTETKPLLRTLRRLPWAGLVSEETGLAWDSHLQDRGQVRHVLRGGLAELGYSTCYKVAALLWQVAPAGATRKRWQRLSPVARRPTTRLPEEQGSGSAGSGEARVPALDGVWLPKQPD
jgi:hypothetical protein